MSSDEIAISARGLGKSYVIEHKEREATAAETLLKYLANPFRKAEKEVLWSLRDVSFDIKRGDIVGVVGRNGAGKSTLLKVLSRITAPSTGEARIKGRIGSLIEVGTGFQPELTGRENIFLNGAILGMRKNEIARRFDEIVDFSGVEKFLDTPVKRYSSGMYVRLAFAVAAHLDTEILLVDEVLSVGDAEFQKKSLGKIGDVAKSGRTVMFVSHNTATMEALCTTGMLLQSGQLLQYGPLKDTLAEYHRVSRSSLAEESGAAPIELGNKYRHFMSIDLVDEDGASTRNVPMGSPLRIAMRVQSQRPVEFPNYMIFIDSAVGQRMLTIISPKTENALPILNGVCDIQCDLDRLPLAPGEYFVQLVLRKSGNYLEETDNLLSFTVRDADTFRDGWGAGRGVCVAPSRWSMENVAASQFRAVS
jgi:lipopolysaccharide transport system ATP-binding protein